MRAVNQFYPMVYGWCRRAGLQPEDAADVCQDVFRGVAGRVGEFRRTAPGDTFRGWVRRITQRRLADHRQRRSREPEALGGSEAHARWLEVVDGAGDDWSCEQGESGIIGALLEQVRSEFESASWQAFWRAAVDGQPAAVVADELGLTANAVYLAKSRILRRLRQVLAETVGRTRGVDGARASEP
ncbi:MAG: sigma-70 family RNA polymerase sigma factor [Gemmataceae bacterium]|nr:sigma-70 family RNA polymerase sigma factor [Gemmataceae bacterium]